MGQRSVTTAILKTNRLTTSPLSFHSLVNGIQAGSVKKVQTSKMAFKCMENINSFLAAAKALGVSSEELFQTVDLWEQQNLHMVVLCLQALGRKVRAEESRERIQTLVRNVQYLMIIFHSWVQES